jgi:hypothetical protein
MLVTTPSEQTCNSYAAVQALLASAALQRDNIQAHLLMSRIFRGQRKLSCALHHVLEVIRIQGDSVDLLAALAFLLQRSPQRAPALLSKSEGSSSSLTFDIQQRLCSSLHAAAAVYHVTLPPSICLLAPPSLHAVGAAPSCQWSAFVDAHMAEHMRSHSFVPGQHPQLHLCLSCICFFWLNRSMLLKPLFPSRRKPHEVQLGSQFSLTSPLQSAAFFLPNLSRL